MRFDGDRVTRPDSRRGVVFQQYAIFPWLTVEKNIAFGLTLKRNRRSARRDRGERRGATSS